MQNSNDVHHNNEILVIITWLKGELDLWESRNPSPLPGIFITYSPENARLNGEYE